MNPNNQLALAQSGVSFLNLQSFELAQRVGNMLSNSLLVPDTYRGNVANCVLALDIAERTGSNVLMVMQNLNLIHGKPSWSSQYIIAAITSCGRFTPLRYDVRDLGAAEIKGIKLPKNLECVAYAWETTLPLAERTKENRLESAPVSFETAVKEGWWTKNGSKWQTMSDLMLRYRAATLFGRMYAPDVLMGMQSREEVEDIIEVEAIPATDERKALALENKLTDTPAAPRKKKGVAAATPAPVDATQPEFDATPVKPVNTEPTSAPAEAPAAPAAPADEYRDRAKVRTAVKKAEQLKLPDGRLITKVELEGEEFTGQVFFEKPLVGFEAGDGQVIDAEIGRKPHKTTAGQFVNVLIGYTLIA